VGPRGCGCLLAAELGRQVLLIGPHDVRVTFIISNYGKYGSGRLSQNGLMRLYLVAITWQHHDDKPFRSNVSLATSAKERKNEIHSVWRDVRSI
jgi:hypothetical protein